LDGAPPVGGHHVRGETRLSAGPGAISGAVGVNHVFVPMAAGTIWELYRNPSIATSTWFQWPGLGAAYLPGKIAAVASRTSRYDIAVLGINPITPTLRTLFFRSRWDTPSAGGTNWLALGGPSSFGSTGYFRSDPAMGSQRPNQIDVALIGSDNNLWIRSTNTGDFSDGLAWRNLGNPGRTFVGNPAYASWGDGRWDIFATDTTGTLWHIWSDAGFQGSWEFWTTAGALVDAGVDAAAMGYGNLLVTFRNNKQPYRMMWTNAGLGTVYADATGASNNEAGTAADW
jgi:hypothetical protein